MEIPVWSTTNRSVSSPLTWNQRATPAGARLPTSQTLPHPPLATWSALKGHHDPPPRAHMTPKCPQMLPDKAPPGTTLIFRSLRRLRKPTRRQRSTFRSAMTTIATLTVTTKHEPWEGTNNGHPTMILTGMTHGHYQPALHPPPSDLGKISPLLPNHHHQSPSMAFTAAPSMGHKEAQTLDTTTPHSLL